MVSFEVLPPRPLTERWGPIVSLIVHLMLVVPFVLPLRTPEAAGDPIEQLVVFLVPPREETGAGGGGVVAQWSDRQGSEGITAPAPAATESPVAPVAGEPGDPSPLDSVIPGRLLATETALSEVEVDSMVERDPNSAAPRYPEALLAKNIEGSTFVHYVVDTLGRVDTTTIRVIRTTAPDFAVSVRAALAEMRFRPAIQASRKVRQWVEQNFAFRIVKPAPPDTT